MQGILQLDSSELADFLYRYEEHLAREAGMFDPALRAAWEKVWSEGPEQSIEHISPQSAGEEWTHRLGNLMLIPVQIQEDLRDKRPDVKRKMCYMPCGGASAREVAERIQESDGWTLEDVEWRERKMLDWAKQEWA